MNVCRDARRALWFQRVTLGELPPRAAPPAPEVSSPVWEAVETLGARQREIVLLHYQQGFTCEEIAALLHMPKGSVSSALLRARKRLAIVLGGENDA